MEKGAMWLVALVIIATVSGQSQMASSSSYLDAAITGFDPFYMTALTQPDPGRRSKIFQPLATVLDSFVNEEQETNYLPEITVQKIVNFQKYLDFTASAAYKLSSDTDCAEPFLRYENYSSCETKNHQRDRAMLQFFKDTGGEVLFAKTDIVTHTITISSFVITTFTPAFEKAVETLYKEAANPGREPDKSNFDEFVRLYGTHFSRRTLLGSRAIFGKIFTTRAHTVGEETIRRRCVLEAAREALTPCKRGCNETTQTVFARASKEMCGGEEHEPIVALTGLLPERIFEDWSSVAKVSPNPIFHELEPLSTLFTTEWFEDYFDRIQVRINGTILSQHFNNYNADYVRRMAIGGSNSLQLRGCGLSSDCQIGTECRNEPDTESGFSCIPREDAATATTTTSTTSTTTTPAPTKTKPVPTTITSTTSTTTTPAPTTTSTTSTTTTPAPTTTTTTTTMKPTPTTLKPRPTSMTCPHPAGHGSLRSQRGPPQTLTSHPGFGSSNYDNNMTFSHRISAPHHGYKVRIQIQSFNTESGYDYLLIHDGPDPSYPQLAALSGTQTLTTYTSSGFSMFLCFVADASITGYGFSLTYEIVT